MSKPHNRKEHIMKVRDNGQSILDQERTNLQTAARAVEKKRRVLENEIKSMQGNNQNLAQGVVEMNAEVQELSEISAKLKEQLDEMKALQEENESLQVMLEDLQKQSAANNMPSKLKATHNRLSDDILEMKHRLNVLIKERDTTKAEFDEAKKKLEEVNKHL